ncbi:MAG: DUF6531 domain-containing protein, partial [Verrucomicrobiae bacterium]|nr:DUF6531 domain-containing protein [Verrucomicrobiae bacterium]
MRALALRSDGTVWSWGTNLIGELGLGTNAFTPSPRRIVSLSNIVAISAGPLHSLAVEKTGAVWAWGTNGNGRLGTGNSLNASNPVAVLVISNAIDVAAGANHSLAVLSNGYVMAWGANDGGQLGTGNTVGTNRPVQVGTLANVIAVAAGSNFSIALTRSGEVWSWGTNNVGQLGLGDNISRLTPVKVNALSNIVQIAAGSSHALARDSSGNLFAWGRNTEGQLGIGNLVNTNLPVRLASFGPMCGFGAAEWIAANFNSSAAINSAGRLCYWGWYGNGTTTGTVAQPTMLGGRDDQLFDKVSYGENYLLAIQDDAAVWAWGFNLYGNWGNGFVYSATDTCRYETVNAQFCFSARPTSFVTRFNRGDRYWYRAYNSFVLPLDLERGVRLDAEGEDMYCYGRTKPWFLQVKKTTRQHALSRIGSSTNLTRFNVDNPIVAFGSAGGGSPLYTQQPYTFGAFGGAFDEKTGQTNMIRILVYDRAAFSAGASNVTPINVVTISLPRRFIAADSNAWSTFVTNGNRKVVETNGLRTVIEFGGEALPNNDPFHSWGLTWQFGKPQTNVVLGGYKLTHTASTTNYCYIVEVLGSVEAGTNVMAPMALTNNTGWAYLPLYAMDFEERPPWRSYLIDSPHFEGIPLPPAYAGRSLSELNNMTAVVTNSVWLTNNPAYTNLDTSPELRCHPILDQFVEDMGRDPLALASYVINEIELTDPFAAQDGSKLVAESIELGGVNRSALGVFLEGQGSPSEQCALLVYLLRRAGYTAGYVFPTNNNLRLLDTRVSQLWQINVKGVIYYAGVPVVTNSLIVANYPWVVANIGTNCVHIFPWLKDTEIVEGLDIYDYMPTNYPSAYEWLKDYAFAKPELINLAEPNATAATVWKRYLTEVLNTNQARPGLSLDDFGVRAFNRRNSYPTWGHLPLPNFLTNQSQVAVVPTLSEDPVTHPFLTNIFDRVRIEVFKDNTNSVNRIFDTGMWRSCDLHNRKLLLYTNTATTVCLWLAPFRPGLTNNSYFTNFESGLASLNLQMVQTNIATAVTNLPIRVTYQRRAYTYPSAISWFPIRELPLDSYDLSARKRDVTAICSSFGRVTPAMLRVHAEDYWRLQQQRALDPSFTPPITDDAGTAATMLGLGFFEKLWTDDAFNQNLHKVKGLTWRCWATAAFTRLTNNQMEMRMHASWMNTLILGNARLRQDSGDRGGVSLNNYLTMLQANGASAEHSIIHSMLGANDSISSVRLLQLAAERSRSNGWAAPIELNVKNYIAAGSKAYTGYGSTLLKDQDPRFWQQVSNAFTSQWDSNFVRILITPGQVTNATGSFRGMSALIFGKWQNGALMSDNQVILNGGFAADLFWIGTPTFPTYQLSYNLQYSPTIGFSFVYNSFWMPTPRFDFSQYDLLTLTTTSGVNQVAFTPQQVTQASVAASSLNIPSSSTAGIIKTAKDRGWLGQPWAGIKQAGTILADPVQVVFGDFYSDTVDLVLAGPFPLQLRRNYLSRNLADNQFGHGWKLSFMPWLVLSTNAQGQSIIHAAEPDGSVLVYRFQSNDVWTVTFEDNPTLVNFTQAGIGSTANLFQNRIQKYSTNGTTYVLTAADGSRRTYQVMTNFALSSGTNLFSRIRPYLTRWEDHAGNYHLFFYGTNSQSNDFGQLNRVQSANGAFLVLKYDFYGRITEAFTDDGRRVRYQYDNYGDLVSVRLPDDSTWAYEYQRYTFTTNSRTYTDSTHLLTRVIKPDGRILANTYDNLRRVIAQAATVCTNRVLVTNAWFFYTNNCTSLTNEFLTGVTRVEDFFRNPYFYYYTNNLITRIVEPLGRTTVQNWFEPAETNKPGYYPRSIEFTIDPRSLTNEFRYDARGNVTNLILRGDLTGSGITSESATNTFTYTNNLVATATDPAGNRIAFYYEDAADPYRLTRTELSHGGVGIATNRFSYTNVTTTVDMGGRLRTNRAFGVLIREIRADTATNEWVFNGRGFPIQSIRHARTADFSDNTDPAVTNFLTFTARGDLSELSDARGRRVRMSFDAMGRLQWRDVLDESGAAVARESFYYNRNGELEWYDGPRSNPEDFIWFDYDGAGRKTVEIRWRSRAKQDGSGVEAETGDNLYATTFFEYDPFGNLVRVTDPLGNYSRKYYDALGRLVREEFYDANGALLATNGFRYNAAGDVTNVFNALGGLTDKQYTGTGKLKFQRNPDGSTNAWRYYPDGRLHREIQRNGAYWEYTYDDANRRTVRIFYSAAGAPLATNVSEFDRRGNLIKTTDPLGNTFVTIYDGLDRVKATVGPAIVTVTEDCGLVPGCGNFVTNVLRQAATNYYDAAGVWLTNINALGEKTVTRYDALGRVTRVEIRNSANALERETATAYHTNHHGFTVTNGAGATAIVSTTYTSTDGQTVLEVRYPASGYLQYTLHTYDRAGRRIGTVQYSKAGAGPPLLWSFSIWDYDGLNRITTEINRDWATTSYQYDPLGNVTNRLMPGGLKWQARYNNAGQMLEEKNVGSDGAVTRTITYAYYPAGHRWAGLLQTRNDGRNVACTYGYDDWLRTATNAFTGPAPEHNLAVIWQYDPRGLLTNAVETWSAPATNPPTIVRRAFDPYGQMSAETVSLGAAYLSSAQMTYDPAGRRSQLSLNTPGASATYSFGWRADGALESVIGPAGTAVYSYDTAGLLTARSLAGRTATVTSRDGVGRPYRIETAIGGTHVLIEDLGWYLNGQLAEHTIARWDYTDARSYAYADLSLRLIEERLNLSATQRWTNYFTYDGGASAGPGVLTRIGGPGATPAAWAAGADAFCRISAETNTVLRRTAYGTVNGPATVTATLDGQPVPVTLLGTNGGQWRAALALRPGAHQLVVSAAHPSGQYVTNAVSWFTNAAGASDRAQTHYDALGQPTLRLWRRADGATNRTQTLCWDARGRLCKLIERDSANNGYDWAAVYDAFGRRLQTVTVVVSNGVALPVQAKVITSCYDPA